MKQLLAPEPVCERKSKHILSKGSYSQHKSGHTPHEARYGYLKSNLIKIREDGLASSIHFRICNC